MENWKMELTAGRQTIRRSENPEASSREILFRLCYLLQQWCHSIIYLENTLEATNL